MLVNGPLPITPNEQVGRTESTFRPYQRVVAEVLQVSATQAILNIEGAPVVARLTSPEQAAALKDQRMAQFIVTQMDGNTINLKLVQPNQAGNAEIAAARQDLAGRFLGDLNLPPTANNINLAQAMLNHKLPLSLDVFQELSTVLTQFGEWDGQLADLAATIKAAGLPLTPDSLSLAALSGNGAKTLDDLFSMLKGLLSRNNLPDDFRALLDSAVKVLNDIRANPENPRPELAKALENQILLNGRSLENILLENSGDKSPLWPEKSLVLLSRLHTLAESMGEQELSQQITKYLDQSHQIQFWNVRSGQPQVAEEWLEIPLYFQSPDAASEEETQQAELRIFRNQKHANEKVDPANTHLTIEMEVAPGKIVQVNLSIASKQTRTDVVVGDEQILEYAQLEFPELEQGMQSLGYLMSENNLRVGNPKPKRRKSISTNAQSSNMLTVNLEV